MSSVIDNKFSIGKPVYVKSDADQRPRYVTGIIIRQAGLTYLLSGNKYDNEHYDFELSTEKNVLLATSGCGNDRE